MKVIYALKTGKIIFIDTMLELRVY